MAGYGRPLLVILIGHYRSPSPGGDRGGNGRLRHVTQETQAVVRAASPSLLLPDPGCLAITTRLHLAARLSLTTCIGSPMLPSMLPSGTDTTISAVKAHQRCHGNEPGFRPLVSSTLLSLRVKIPNTASSHSLCAVVSHPNFRRYPYPCPFSSPISGVLPQAPMPPLVPGSSLSLIPPQARRLRPRSSPSTTQLALDHAARPSTTQLVLRPRSIASRVHPRSETYDVRCSAAEANMDHGHAHDMAAMGDGGELYAWHLIPADDTVDRAPSLFKEGTDKNAQCVCMTGKALFAEQAKHRRTAARDGEEA